MLLRERVAAKLAMRVGIREVTNHAVASHSIVFRIVHVCFRIVEGSLAHGACLNAPRVCYSFTGLSKHIKRLVKRLHFTCMIGTHWLHTKCKSG